LAKQSSKTSPFTTDTHVTVKTKPVTQLTNHCIANEPQLLFLHILQNFKQLWNVPATQWQKTLFKYHSTAYTKHIYPAIP